MLEKLFTSKARVEILKMMLFNQNNFGVREISREIRKPVSAVSREIKNLSSLGLIQRKESKISLNEESNIVQDLRNIFLKTDAFAYEMKKLFKKPSIKYAFVFGSFANNNYNPESDIDLFVIGNVSNSDIIKLIKPIESKLKREINPVVWSLNDLKKKSKNAFVKEIATRNIVMLKGKEDEVRQIIGRK